LQAAWRGTDKPVGWLDQGLQGWHLHVGPLVPVQSLSHHHRYRGRVNTPGKHIQETAILEGSYMLVCMPSMGRDTLGHDIPEGHHAGLVLGGRSHLCQPWMVPGLPSVSARATRPRARTRAGLQPRATLTWVCGGSLGLS